MFTVILASGFQKGTNQIPNWKIIFETLATVTPGQSYYSSNLVGPENLNFRNILKNNSKSKSVNLSKGAND